MVQYMWTLKYIHNVYESPSVRVCMYLCDGMLFQTFDVQKKYVNTIHNICHCEAHSMQPIWKRVQVFEKKIF